MGDEILQWFGRITAPSAAELADCYALSQLVKVYALGIDMRDYDWLAVSSWPMPLPRSAAGLGGAVEKSIRCAIAPGMIGYFALQRQLWTSSFPKIRSSCRIRPVGSWRVARRSHHYAV